MTEKVTGLQDSLNQYGFVVDARANKIQIKEAVESRFKVKVEKVRTMKVRGKIKRLGRFSGRQPDWKKAIVSLAKGDKINLVEGV